MSYTSGRSLWWLSIGLKLNLERLSVVVQPTDREHWRYVD